MTIIGDGMIMKTWYFRRYEMGPPDKERSVS